MKKTLTLVFAFCTIILGTGFSCSAAVEEKEGGFISVNASSVKEVTPDQAQIVVSIETSDKSLQKATDENKVIADKVYSSLKGLLNTEKGDYIKTGKYSANPLYVNQRDNKRVFDKYVVTNSVTVKTKSIQTVAKMLDMAINSGATRVNNLEFSVSNYDSECSDILSELTKRAYSQANAIAGSINSKITGVRSITSSCNPESASRPYYAMMAKDSMEQSSETPIESGKIKIHANVDASFYVK